MQVKKFEAATMQEALYMVKNQLGPEAVILSAKDNSNGFGLKGGSSVEITAAVSEETLRKKKLAEAKLKEDMKSQWTQSPARQQKQFIDKVFSQYQKENESKQFTRVPYIDIDDGSEEPTDSNPEQSNQRIKQAAQKAWKAVQASEAMSSQPTSSKSSANTYARPNSTSVVRVNSLSTASQAPGSDMGTPSVQSISAVSQGSSPKTSQIQALESEVKYLRGLLENFNKMPQSFVSMHPGAQHGLPYELSLSYEKLQNAGISEDNTVEILELAQSLLEKPKLKKQAYVDAWVAKYLMDSLAVVKERASSRYHAFVGPSGQGKTSSLVKFASELVMQHKKKVAIITTDAYKVAAADQLKIYAQILNLPFAVLKNAKEWEQVEQKLSHMDHVLVDYPSSNAMSLGEIETLRSLLPPKSGERTVHYVQSVLAKDKDAIDVAIRYKALNPSDVIFTQLDECVQHGMIYNFQKELELPLHSFGIGAHIPEDFEAATKERVIDLLFKLTKLKNERGRT